MTSPFENSSKKGASTSDGYRRRKPLTRPTVIPPSLFSLTNSSTSSISQFSPPSCSASTRVSSPSPSSAWIQEDTIENTALCNCETTNQFKAPCSDSNSKTSSKTIGFSDYPRLPLSTSFAPIDPFERTHQLLSKAIEIAETDSTETELDAAATLTAKEVPNGNGRCQ